MVGVKHYVICVKHFLIGAKSGDWCKTLCHCRKHFEIGVKYFEIGVKHFVIGVNHFVIGVKHFVIGVNILYLYHVIMMSSLFSFSSVD